MGSSMLAHLLPYDGSEPQGVAAYTCLTLILLKQDISLDNTMECQSNLRIQQGHAEQQIPYVHTCSTQAEPFLASLTMHVHMFTQSHEQSSDPSCTSSQTRAR